MKITNDQGEEVEVFTAEELEQQKQAAIDQYKQDNPEKTEEMERLQRERDEANQKLEDANKQLEGELDKDKNFAQLRKQKEDAEAKLNELQGTIDDKIGTAKKEILEDVMRDHYNETIERLTGGDEDLKKKVEFQYKRLQDPAGTKEEMNKKLSDAYLLAQGPVQETVDTNVFSSGGVQKLNLKKNQEFTSEEKEFVQRLGQAGGLQITEDDFK